MPISLKLKYYLFLAFKSKWIKNLIWRQNIILMVDFQLKLTI